MGHIREPEKQRAGVYGTARQMVSCLTDREVIGGRPPPGAQGNRPGTSKRRWAPEYGNKLTRERRLPV